MPRTRRAPSRPNRGPFGPPSHGVRYIYAAQPTLIHSATSSRVTASHSNSEVKLDRALAVLPSGRRWEGKVLNVLRFLTATHAHIRDSLTSRIDISCCALRFVCVIHAHIHDRVTSRIEISCCATPSRSLARTISSSVGATLQTCSTRRPSAPAHARKPRKMLSPSRQLAGASR